jgi:prepilin peptidase dependent protein B
MKTQIKPLKAWRTRSPNLSSQAGATLVELLIGLTLSVIVTASMVILMANSIGTATRIIHMSQLSDELRNSMNMITRDLRRANYSASGIFCYGNSQCGASGGISQQAGDVLIDGECISYTLDRNSDGNAANDPVGGFRRVTTGGVGVIEMYTGTADSTPCDTDTGWFQLTDPDIVNVSAFEIDDTASFTRVITENETSTFTNRQRQLTLALEGQVVLEQDAGINMVNRRIEDVIFVRNDYIVL